MKRHLVALTAITTSLVISTIGPIPASAQSSLPPPSASIGIENGDVAVNSSVEPGAFVDAILAILNSFGIRGLQLGLPPNGILPAANVDLKATGAITAKTTVATCADNRICFWDQPNFEGKKLEFRIPRCSVLPEGFHARSVASSLRFQNPDLLT